MTLLTERNETVRAWAHLLTIILLIVVTIFIGWPHYKRYTALLEAKTTVEIAAIKAGLKQ